MRRDPVSAGLGILLFLALIGQAHGQAKSRLVADLEAGKTRKLVLYGTVLTKDGPWAAQVETALARRFPGRITVANRAHGAWGSPRGLQELSSRVLDEKPDAVLLEFAMYDAVTRSRISPEKSRENLEAMMDRIAKALPRCEVILMTTNPATGAATLPRPELRAYYQVCRDVAKVRGLLLIDLEREWRAILDRDEALFATYVPDGLQPNAAGCEKVITPAVLKALGFPADIPPSYGDTRGETAAAARE